MPTSGHLALLYEPGFALGLLITLWREALLGVLAPLRSGKRL